MGRRRQPGDYQHRHQDRRTDRGLDAQTAWRDADGGAAKVVGKIRGSGGTLGNKDKRSRFAATGDGDKGTSESSGETPVYAAYDGYITRLPEWKSSLIIRVPQDPLHPQNQIWLYYTHLADLDGNSYIVSDFPSGTSDLFVEEGTLLGYQGNFSGTIGKPVGVHLHFSIVMDDGKNSFLNELNILNTMDPSPYFDLPLNGKANQGVIPVCQSQETSP